MLAALVAMLLLSQTALAPDQVGGMPQYGTHLAPDQAARLIRSGQVVNCEVQYTGAPSYIDAQGVTQVIPLIVCFPIAQWGVIPDLEKWAAYYDTFTR